MKYGLCADKMPDWLTKLPAGEYSARDAAIKLNVGTNSVYMRFEALEVEKVRKLIDKTWKNIYVWKGASYYYLRIHEQKMKNLQHRYGEAS